VSPEIVSQGVAFLATFVYGSFFEWTLHRFVMHRRQKLLPFPFELHALIHHRLFGPDRTFHARDEEMRRHVTFVPRDYLILLLINAPVFLAVEWLTGFPIALGAGLGVLAYLGAFDALHWMFHVPRGRFIERWRPFRWLKHHHRVHHRYHTRNLNVVVPLADWVFRTRVGSERPVRASAQAH
jgi:hypothetical protein